MTGFTGKERDSETGLDYFGARYFSGAQGRFTTPDPISGTPLHIINPQRWNMYVYGLNNPFSYVVPDGRDAVLVTLRNQTIGGHNGVVSVHSDGRALYTRSGPTTPGNPLFSANSVETSRLADVTFRPDGLPTKASYAELARQIGSIEEQSPDSIDFHYYRTTEADTVALDQYAVRAQTWLQQHPFSPPYSVLHSNCATYATACLMTAHVIPREGATTYIPNLLWLALPPAADSSLGSERKKKEVVKSKFKPLRLKDKDQPQ